MSAEVEQPQEVPREQWASKLGLVLAMAGNAVGLGNFLRFPSQAAQNGGGAFLIPYFVALLLLGIPLMWVEWTMGRFGGQFGHTTTPGMFVKMSRWRGAKYLGALGISLPLLFVVFYTYIESWTLAYAWYSMTGKYFADDPAAVTSEVPEEIPGLSAERLSAILNEKYPSESNPAEVVLERSDWKAPADANWTVSDEAFERLDEDSNGAISEAEMEPVLKPLARAHTNRFLREYQGVLPKSDRQYFPNLSQTVVFWLIAVAINCWIISRGVSGGIEILAKIAMPALFLFAIVLMVRVMMLGAPDPAHPDRSVWAGLNYVWEPDFSRLSDFSVWLNAAGQIFFTLSIGTGTIHCFASYLKKDDDCALTGLTTASTNEFAEVVLGASIAIPIAVATFGLAHTQTIAQQGSFDIGFVAMPLIFEQMPGGQIFATLWFALLFFAGITSSVALSQPLVSFLYEFFGLGRQWAAAISAAVMILLGLPILLLLKTGYLDQYDFWVGTFGLVIFSLVEVVIFGWAFGAKEMWAELNRANVIPIPRIFYYVIRFAAPLYLAVLLCGWTWQNLKAQILLENAAPEDVPYLWMARGTILVVIAICCGVVAMRNIEPITGEESKVES